MSDPINWYNVASYVLLLATVIFGAWLASRGNA